jgi:hypothetical protein
LGGCAQPLTLQGLYDQFPVVLQHSDDRGRYLCASRNVAAGELVYRGEATAAVVHDKCVLYDDSTCLC